MVKACIPGASLGSWSLPAGAGNSKFLLAGAEVKSVNSLYASSVVVVVIKKGT